MPSDSGSPSGVSNLPFDSQRANGGHQQRQSPSAFGSPTSSTISSNPTRMPLRTMPGPSALGVTKKRIVIRADPTMVSTFDPADKELYDLWCPKQ